MNPKLSYLPASVKSKPLYLQTLKPCILLLLRLSSSHTAFQYSTYWHCPRSESLLFTTTFTITKSNLLPISHKVYSYNMQQGKEKGAKIYFVD